MKNLLAVGILSLTLIGCASVPLTKENVQSSVAVDTGYPGCPSCVLVKTYHPTLRASHSNHITDNDFDGWLDVTWSLVMTNFTADKMPIYAIDTSLVTSGPFTRGVSYWVVDESGNKTFLSAADRYRFECFSNIGSGCSWDQRVVLPTQLVDQAIHSHQGFKILVGINQDRVQMGSDGYSPTAIHTSIFRGMTINVTPEYLDGFIAGIETQGGVLPSAKLEAAITKINKSLDTLEAKNQAKKMIAERPKKRVVGTKVCQRMGPWVIVGFVENSTNEKIQIRESSETYITNPQIHAGNFSDKVIWDNPDRWQLCDN